MNYADLVTAFLAHVHLGGSSDGPKISVTGINDAAVETAKIKDLAVTTAKINDAAVTEAKLADGGVAHAKLATDAAEADNIKDTYIKLVSESTITVAATEVDFTSLDFVNNVYSLDMVLYNNYAGTVTFYLYCNSDTTNTNYYCQGFRVYGTSLDYARTNAPVLDDVTIGQTLSIEVKCSQPYAGAAVATPRFAVRVDKETPSAVEFKLRSIAWTSSTAVTALKIKASQANGIGIGSKFRLWGRSK